MTATGYVSIVDPHNIRVTCTELPSSGPGEPGRWSLDVYLGCTDGSDVDLTVAGSWLAIRRLAGKITEAIDGTGVDQ